MKHLAILRLRSGARPSPATPRPASAGAPLGLLLATLLPLACGTVVDGGEKGEHAPVLAEKNAHGPARILGTAIDAASRKPLAGVLVEGPNGVLVRTNAEGRFELTGLVPGTVGTIEATTETGLAGSVKLRPLSSGVLEIVLHMRK